MLVYPFLVLHQWTSSHAYHLFVSKKELVEENKQLQRLYEDALEEVIRLKATVHYEEALYDLAPMPLVTEKNDIIVGHIMLRHLDGMEHYMLVDRGSMHGIAPDMVALYRNMIVGKVTDVYPRHCKIMLISDAACRISVYSDQTKVGGIYQGNNNTQHGLMNHVSHLQPLLEQEYVFSSGEGLIYPRGFVLGKISSIEKENVEQRVRIELLVDLMRIEFVYLIAKKTE